MARVFKIMVVTCCMSFAAQAMEGVVGGTGSSDQTAVGMSTVQSLKSLLHKASLQGNPDALKEFLSRDDQSLVPAVCQALKESSDKLALLNRLTEKVTVCTAPEETGPYILVADHLQLSGEDRIALYEVLRCSCAYEAESVKVSDVQDLCEHAVAPQSSDLAYKYVIKKHYASAQARYEAARRGYKEVTESLSGYLKQYCTRYMAPEKVDAFFADQNSLALVEAVFGVQQVFLAEGADQSKG